MRPTATRAGRSRAFPSARAVRCREIGTLVLLGAVAAVLLWLRLPPVARDTMWAEDGKQFLAGAEQYGPLNLFTPYAGYLQVVPRLIAAAVVHVPVAQWARGMTLGACIVSGAVTVLVYCASASVVSARLPRLVIAAVTVLLPLGPRDVFGNPTNIHSVLMWALFWVVLAQPVTRRGQIAFSVAGMLCALSEIQAVFLVPLIAIRARRRDSWLLLAGPVLGVLAQLVATVADPRHGSHAAPVGIPSLFVGYLINAVLTLFTSISKVGPAIVDGELWVARALLLGLLALVVLTWGRMPTRTRLAVVAALVLSPLIYVVSVTVNPAEYYEYATMSPAQLGDAWITRYGVVPGMLLLAVAVVSASTIFARPVGRRRGTRIVLRGVAAATIAAVLLSCIVFFVPSWTRRSDGPEWAPAARAAAARCERSGAQRVEIEETLHWRVPVSCALLIGTRGG